MCGRWAVMTSEAWSVGCARVARALRNGALDLDLVGEALDADALGIRRSSSSTPRVSIATAHTRLRAVTAATRTPGAGCHCPPTYRQQPVQSTAMKCLSRERFGYQEWLRPHSLPPPGFVGARQRADGRRRRTPRAVVSAQNIQARVTPASLKTATRTRYGRTK